MALIVDRAKAEPGAILVPVVAGNRGHPVAMPWLLALRVRALPAGVGINALLALNAAKVVEVEVSDPGAVGDLDTPDDYERWGGR